MKRIFLVVTVFVVLVASIALAADSPPPNGPDTTGGCTGQDCR